MTIYAADVLDYGSPTKIVKEKKPRKRKELPVEEGYIQQVDPILHKMKKAKKSIPSPPTSESSADQPKPKKERTPAQLAAFEKAKATRQRKKEEALTLAKQTEEEIQSKQKEIAAKEAEIAAKKAAMAEKRRLAREAKKVDKQVDELVDIEQGKPKIEEDKPPKWFQKYVEKTRVQEAKDTGLLQHPKEVEKDATKEAQTKWQNGIVRDRVQNEVNHHRSKMYQMIFGRSI